MEVINQGVTDFLSEWVWDDMLIAMMGVVVIWFLITAFDLITSVLDIDMFGSRDRNHRSFEKKYGDPYDD